MSMMRRLLWGLPVIGALAAGGLLLTQKGVSAPEKANGGNAQHQEGVADLKPAVSLPISQVILFNSGVGHFTRSGEVDGDARVDLTFPEQDINDLIKSMTLRDLSPNGRVAAVTYDSHDPIDRTLASFAINLNNSPPLSADPDAGAWRASRSDAHQHREPTGQPDGQDHRGRTAGRAVERGAGHRQCAEPVVCGRRACRQDVRSAAAAFREPGHRE